MDDEILVSGYCRAQDQSRMVTLEKIDGRWGGRLCLAGLSVQPPV